MHEKVFYYIKLVLLSRILVFTPADVTDVSVSIDEQPIGQAEHSSGPLYVLAWQPELIRSVVHSYSFPHSSRNTIAILCSITVELS